MTYIGTRNFLIEVQKGNVPGHSLLHKFGRNDGVPNGSFEFVTLLGQTGHALSAATTVRLKAGGNVNDTAAGTGAQAIIVQGIDSTFAEIQETIATAGGSASSATSASFWRVHRAWVHPSGAYGGNNVGAVTVENSAGGTDIIVIGAAEGQSQDSVYTIPLGKTGYFLSATITVDASKPGDIRICKRENMDDTTTPYSATRLLNYFDGVVGTINFVPVSPGGALPAKTDFWVEAQGGGAGTEVSCDFELLLVDD